MGLGDRLGLIFTNFAILLPVFIILVATAVNSSIAAAKLAALNDQTAAVKSAHWYVSMSTIVLWCLFAGGLVGGFIFIPILAGSPYFFGTLMFLFALLNLTISIIMFYSAVAAKNSKDYANNTDTAKTAYSKSVLTGILMMVAGIFMAGYAFWSISHYRKMGGIAGDAAIFAQVAPYLGPEAAPFAMVADQYAQANLTPEQLQQTGAQNIPGLASLGGQFLQGAGYQQGPQPQQQGQQSQQQGQQPQQQGLQQGQQPSQGSIQQGLSFAMNNPQLVQKALNML